MKATPTDPPRATVDLLPMTATLLQALIDLTHDLSRVTREIGVIVAQSKTTPAASAVPIDTDDRIVTTEELLARVPLDRSTVWRMVRENRFPKPIRLTPARNGWRWSAVLAWLKDREEHPVAARSYGKRTPRGPR